MYIITQVGRTLVHKIGDIRITADTAMVVIESHSLDPIVLPGGIVTQTTTNQVPVPISVLSANPATSIASWLVSEDGPYTGGTVASDEEYEFLAKRSDLHMKAKRARDDHEQAGVTVTPHGTFDSDPDSQRKISGAVVMAMLALQNSEAFAMDWRLKDNSIVTLDALGMIEVGVAVGQHVAACQGRKNALDALIDAATTVEDLDAIDVTTGWPA